jgi:hypothetical protein
MNGFAPAFAAPACLAKGQTMSFTLHGLGFPAASPSGEPC